MAPLTFSETRLLLPFNNSGAIHGSVPRTPPDTRVLRLILDNPKSPTCKNKHHRQMQVVNLNLQLESTRIFPPKKTHKTC